MISDKRVVQDFLSRLKQWDIRDIVLSPGSRNAPFSISLHNHPFFRVHVIVDERTAGFFALGMSQQSGRPSVLICTSGTAVLNYAPAIAEAYYQQVSLFVVTADRPPEWIEHGEGQSIRQSGVYRNYTRWFGDMLTDGETDEHAASINRNTMDEAMRQSMGNPMGPVHLNFPFYEPLYGLTGEERAGDHDNVVNPAQTSTLNDSLDQAIVDEVRRANRILVIAGQLSPDNELNRELTAFSERYGAAVMTETHSNLCDSGFISTIDRCITHWDDRDKKRFAPDLVITLGKNIVSRRIKAWLRASDCSHWIVDTDPTPVDVFRKLARVIQLEPAVFFRELKEPETVRTYRSELIQNNGQSRKTADQFLLNAPFSDLKAVDVVLNRIPDGTDVQMGNSSVVRYIQLFDQRPNLRYFGNRGVSGIDGCTSTAIGAAWKSGRPTVLITGDVGFLYDSNAFWHAYHPADLRIIVLNNNGGGIFRIIDGPAQSSALEACFETVHQRSAGEISTMYRLPFCQAHNQHELFEGLDWLFSQSQLSVLEVVTPRTENDQILKQYFDFIKSHHNSAIL